MGKHDRAVALLWLAMATFRDLGDQWNIGVTLHMLGDIALVREDWVMAIACYQESLAHHWTQRDPLGVMDALLRLAQILVARGELDLTTRFLECAEAQLEVWYERRTDIHQASQSLDCARTCWNSCCSLD
jgi:hypothetical protein